MARVPLSDQALIGVISELAKAVDVALNDPRRSADNKRIDGLMAPQEILDFLALLAGQKPLYLIRGFGTDLPNWVQTVRAIAERYGCSFITGPGLIGENPYADAPEVMQAHSEAVRSWSVDQSAYHYVVADPRTAAKLTGIMKRGGQTTVADEAALLGYPECCVRDYYARHRRVAGAYVSLVMRCTGGDPEKVRTFDGDAEEHVLTPEEEAVLGAELGHVQPIPYTSLNACSHCFGSERSPGRRLGLRNRALADRVSPPLSREIQSTYDQAHRKDALAKA